jgi:glycogen operon protein
VATRIAGSADVFGEQACRSVNFVAAHDGFTLADTVAYEQRHNYANGEDNRDGHGENHSWNCGVEGPSDDLAVIARRGADMRALLGMLFASAGTIMLTAGDEFGRSQQGNNNAYCQDGPIGWIDWAARDVALEDDVAAMAALRAGRDYAQFPREGEWLRADGAAMAPKDWASAQGMCYVSHDVDRRQGFVLDRAARVVRMA